MRSKGDTLQIGFTIKDKCTHQFIPREDIDDLVFQINNDTQATSIEKLLSRGDISYDSEGQFFYFNLTQEDTFALKETNLYNVRVLDVNGNVMSNAIGSFNLDEALNHRVLGEEEGGNDEL